MKQERKNILTEEAMHLLRGLFYALTGLPAVFIIYLSYIANLNDQNTVVVGSIEYADIWVRVWSIVLLLKPDVYFELWLIAFLLLFYPYLFFLLIRLTGYLIKALVRKPNPTRDGTMAESKNDISKKNESYDAAGDPDYINALLLAFDSGRVAVTLLQMKLRIGYIRAGRFIEKMEESGYLGRKGLDGYWPVDVSREEALEIIRQHQGDDGFFSNGMREEMKEIDGQTFTAVDGEDRLGRMSSKMLSARRGEAELSFNGKSFDISDIWGRIKGMFRK